MSNSTIAKISVTFRFDNEFISKLHLFPEYALLILAPIEVITMKDYGVKNLKALLWRYNQQNITKGADLMLFFMDALNEETLSMSYYYKISY